MTWYQEPTRESDDSQLPSSSRASDALSGTDRTSYQVRQTIEDDEERLAMKQGDMPPPVPERVANPRIRDDRAVAGISIETRTRCTVPLLMTPSHKHG